jgi:VanZ family protein
MRRLWLVLVLAVILGSLLPGGSAPLRALSLLHINDKAQHFLAYALLACLPAWMASRPSLLRTGLFLLAIGLLLEILQSLVPGRACDLSDGLSDAAGIVVGGLFGASCAVLRASISRIKVAPG